MTLTRTPGPWFQGQVKGTEHQIFNSESGVFLDDDEANHSDIAYIVRACNAHEELVNALETIEGQLEQHPDADKGNSKVHYCLHMAKQALEQAK